MGRLICVIIAAFIAFAPPHLAALTFVGAGGLPGATDYRALLPPELIGVVSWKTLAHVAPVKESVAMPAK